MFSMDESISQQKFTNATVGLQTHEQYKSKAKIYLTHHDDDLHEPSKDSDNELENQEDINKEQLIKIKKKSIEQTNTLSFADDTDEDEEEEDIDLCLIKDVNDRKRKVLDDRQDKISPLKKRKIIHKNPNVNTSFLPDPERDLKDEQLRKELEREWYNKQKQIKGERLEITYSYWDGSGHRRSIEITKGMSIGEFLELVRKELSTHFSELRGINGDYLMYIKDDLIIPHSYLFYDLVVTKARGKSGHLMFKNAIYDKGDYVIDKDSGHPGKVITRSWYDRNKHIFPASRWELYDPQSQDKVATN